MQTKLEKMKKINEYIYFPYSYWSFNAHEELLKNYTRNFFQSDIYFIKEEDFYNIKFLNTILSRLPMSVMGDCIRSYQKEVVPKIIEHLKEEFNDLYLELIKVYPKFEILNVNYIGRKAQINTLVPYVEFQYNGFKTFFDGEFLVIKNYSINSMFLQDIKINDTKNKLISFKIEVSDKDYIIIKDNKQCDKHTKFIN